MDHAITNELLKLNFNQVNVFVFSCFMFVTLAFLICLTILVYEIYMQDYYDIEYSAFFSVILEAAVIFLGVNIFTPLSLTQKTEIKTEKLNIVRVEDKLSDTDELKLLLTKSGRNDYKNEIKSSQKRLSPYPRGMGKKNIYRTRNH